MSALAQPLIADLRDAGDLPEGPIRASLAEHGCVLLRGLLPRERVLAVRRVIIGMMQTEGWLESCDPLRARPEMPLQGKPGYMDLYRRVLHHPEFAALAHAPELLAAMGEALGGAVQVHKRIIARLAPPHQPPTQPHQDWHYIRGTDATLTAWIPLGDCPRTVGGLAVLPGTQRLGYRAHVRSTGAGGMGVPCDDLDGSWLSADYRIGDVLIFPALTIHASMPNRSGLMRLSADFRYQRPNEAIDPDSLRHHYGLD